MIVHDAPAATAPLYAFEARLCRAAVLGATPAGARLDVPVVAR